MADLQALVDHDDLAGLLEHVTLEDIADAWWRYQLRSDAERKKEEDDDGYDHPDWWAVGLWHQQAIYGDHALLRGLLHQLADRAPAGADLGYVGAGPLENAFTNDDDWLTWVEQEAASSPSFRSALANVWIDSWAFHETFLRAEAAAGMPLSWGDRGPRPSADTRRDTVEEAAVAGLPPSSEAELLGLRLEQDEATAWIAVRFRPLYTLQDMKAAGVPDDIAPSGWPKPTLRFFEGRCARDQGGWVRTHIAEEMSPATPGAVQRRIKELRQDA